MVSSARREPFECAFELRHALAVLPEFAGDLVEPLVHVAGQRLDLVGHSHVDVLEPFIHLAPQFAHVSLEPREQPDDRAGVSQAHKAPIVAVNVWYDVGAADEAPGKTGFAHLFEHLMFNGSEHFNDDYFKPFDRVGATGMNGTTNQDRTNYFQVVPTTALDMALWMESDRMGHMLGAVDQERLDEQRGVVQNEKRQGENQPCGKVFLTIFENTYPDGHFLPRGCAKGRTS